MAADSYASVKYEEESAVLLEARSGTQNVVATGTGDCRTLMVRPNDHSLSRIERFRAMRVVTYEA